MEVKSLFDGRYEVTSDGEVYSLLRGCRRRMIGEINIDGYRRLSLSMGIRKIRMYEHRIIAEAFIPNPENLSTVNHRNSNKLDNRIENLEWLSSRDNTIHAIENGFSGTCGITRATADAIRGEVGRYRSIAEKYATTIDTVKSIKCGRTWPPGRVSK